MPCSPSRPLSGYGALLEYSQPHVTGDALGFDQFVGLAEVGRIESAGVRPRGVNRSEHGAECSRPDCVCHSLGPERCTTPQEEAVGG